MSIFNFTDERSFQAKSTGVISRITVRVTDGQPQKRVGRWFAIQSMGMNGSSASSDGLAASRWNYRRRCLKLIRQRIWLPLKVACRSTVRHLSRSGWAAQNTFTRAFSSYRKSIRRCSPLKKIAPKISCRAS